MTPKQEIEALCKKLKPVIGDQADMLWYMYLSEDGVNREKFARDIEIIAEKFLNDIPLDKRQILLEPPNREDSKGTYLLGDIIYNKKKLHSLGLRSEDFLKQVGIFAITGEGKTNLAYLLSLQLLKTKTPFMVIDWKRSWRNLLSLSDDHPELKDIKVYTIGRDTLPFLWNVFRPPPGTDKGFWVGTISDALERSHLSGPGVAYYFNKIYSSLFKALPDDFYPNFFDGLREIQKVRTFGREQNWKQTAMRIFQSFTLGKASKVFNARNPIKLEDLLDKPVILELDLELPKPLRMFLSEIILKWIHLYRLSRGETDNLKHVLFLEEAHNLFLQNSFYKDNKSIENLYREIRGFGQGIVSITQHPSLLPIELLGNCHTQIYLGLQHADDIKMARKSLFIDYSEDEYFNILDVGQCIVKVKNRIEPCLVNIPFVPVKKDLVTDEWLKNHHLGCLFWEHAWKKVHGASNFLSLKKDITAVLDNTPRIEKENTPGHFPGKPDGKISASVGNRSTRASESRELSPVNIDEVIRKHPDETRSRHMLLIDILTHPFTTITRRYKRLKLHSKLGNKCRKALIADKCIIPKKIITGKGWITLFELTRKGKLILGDLGYEFKNESEGVVHKYWKHKVSDFYRKEGLDVRVEEYYVNGRPDIIVTKDKKKIAIEIETGKSDFIKNVKRALAAGFDEVYCVAVNRFVEEKISMALREKKLENEKVKVIGIRGFS